MPSRPSILLLVTALFACTPRAGEDGSVDSANEAKPPIEPEPGTAVEAEPSAQPQDSPSDPSYAVMQKVCASDCAGRFARVQVYRDAEGGVAKLVFDGDIETCSHPPRLFFDGAGEQLLAVPNRPVEPGSAQAESLARQQAEQLEGLREAERLSCFDASMCARVPEGMRSEFACRSDNDCVECACEPIHRSQWDARGGAKACNIDGEECVATNAACCEGRCVLAR